MPITELYDLQPGKEIDLEALWMKLLKDYPNGHPDQASALRQLADILRHLSDKDRSPAALVDQSIEIGQIAAEKVPLDHPDRAAIFDSLAEDLSYRYASNGSSSTKDIDEAIRLEQEVASIPTLCDLQMQRTSNLAVLLRERYQNTKDSRDLDESIVNLKKARSDAISHGSSKLASVLHNLANSLGLRYCRFKESEDLSKANDDLDEAIEYGRQASDLSRANSVRGPFPSDLCIWLRLRYESQHLQDDIIESLVFGKEAFNATPHDGLAMANLGDVYQTKYEYEPCRSAEDLKNAITFGQKAIEAMPRDHAMRAKFLVSIASRFKLRFEAERGPRDLETAIKYSLECLHLNYGLPLIRIEAGRNAGIFLLECKRWAEAGNALSTAVNLLSRMSPRSLPRNDQQYLLNELSGLSSLAVSALLNSGRAAEDTLIVFETGRGIMARILMGFRDDVSELERNHPTIAAKYKELRGQLSPSEGVRSVSSNTLDSLLSSGSMQKDPTFSGPQGPDKVSLRHAQFDRLDKIEREIRNLDGFDRFQLPSSSNESKRLARGGPIVCFNVTKYGSHAILITEEEIRFIDLPKLQYETLEVQMGRMIGSGKITRGLFSTLWDRNSQMREILRWLWEVAVSPVLKSLGLASNASAACLPRIWWISNGIMGLAPVHAAGIYNSEGSSTEYTSRYVISSYMPSLKALEFSQKGQLTGLNEGFLIIPAPSTPGCNNLRTSDELEAIKNGIKPIEPVVIDMPRKSKVLEALCTCRIAHFACHGVYDPVDPSKGKLLLPGDTMGSVDHLTVQEIANMSHDHAQIAYLSACSTAENSCQGLMDEMIHIASAFQLSGFSHVVGSLWEVDDDAAVQAAKEFYPALIDTNGNSSHRAVAEAVHKAVKTLKDSYAENFLMWAPFIHFGP